ncbi:MAG: FtsW/RodA/SpoVE family cell cycle protein [Phycisphaerae bacterium]
MNRLWEQLAIAANWPILAAVGVLSGMGILSIWSNDPETGIKQLAFLLIAFGAMGLFQTVNYLKLGRLAWIFFSLSLLLVLYTVVGRYVGVPGVRMIKGACNWISFGPVSLQPAELVKVSFIMVLARYLRYRTTYRTLRGLLIPLGLALVPMVLILKQPDLGTVLVFIPTTFVMLFVAGAKLKHFAILGGICLALAPVGWLAGTELPVFRHLPSVVKEYQRERVYAMFRDDEATLMETGFQQHRALIAFGSGGVSGKGAGEIPIGHRVPESHNDMIFALVGEQFGFMGAMVMLVAYVVLFTAGIEIAGNTKEPFGRLLAVGVVACLAGQTFLNIMVCLKLMPVTGVTLPFVSAGGSSLIASFMAAGLLLNIGQNRPWMLSPEAFQHAD